MSNAELERMAARLKEEGYKVGRKIITDELAGRINDILSLKEEDDDMTLLELRLDPRYENLKARLSTPELTQFNMGLNILWRKGYKKIGAMRGVLERPEVYTYIGQLGENRARFLARALAPKTGQE